MPGPLLSTSALIVPLLLAVALANVVLGTLVLCSHPRHSANRSAHLTFALLAFSVALWTLTNALFRTAGSVEGATLWAQLAYAAALSTAAAFLHFAFVYPLSAQALFPSFASRVAGSGGHRTRHMARRTLGCA